MTDLPTLPLLTDAPMAVVHHRKLNSQEGLEGILPALDAYPEYLHVAEGDLCWAQDGDDLLLYMHHPDAVYDTLSPAQLRERADAGELWTLERALDARYDGLLFVVELKTGRGSRDAAIQAAVQQLQARRPGRYWFDTFAIADTVAIKDADPAAITSLHTKILSGSRVLETAPSPVRVRWAALGQLGATDLLTVTYKTSPQRLFAWAGASLAKTVEAVERHDKRVVCGGVATPAMFSEVQRAGARGAYIKFPWDQLPHAPSGA